MSVRVFTRYSVVCDFCPETVADERTLFVAKDVAKNAGWQIAECYGNGHYSQYTLCPGCSAQYKAPRYDGKAPLYLDDAYALIAQQETKFQTAWDAIRNVEDKTLVPMLLHGFKMWEAAHPVNPLEIEPKPIDLITSIEQWIALQKSIMGVSPSMYIGDTAYNSVGQTIRGTLQGRRVLKSTRNSLCAALRDPIRESIGDSDPLWGKKWFGCVQESMWDSVYAYIGGLFPGIFRWKGLEDLGSDPWRPLLNLWYAGYVPFRDKHNWYVQARDGSHEVGIVEAMECD